MKLGEKVKLIREKQGLSQKAFADLLGVSRSHLTNVERDKTEAMPALVNCLSLIYHVDREWLLDDESDDTAPIEGATNMISMIMEGYDRLSPPFKKYVEKQIYELLELQKETGGE